MLLGDERFVSLTTFRRSGEPVSTPVWIARSGTTLLVTTPMESGKVKRLRNSSRIELRPCNRMGKVAEGVEPVSGVAEILEADDLVAQSAEALRAKYGFEYRLIMWIERRSTSGQAKRVILRITES